MEQSAYKARCSLWGLSWLTGSGELLGREARRGSVAGGLAGFQQLEGLSIAPLAEGFYSVGTNRLSLAIVMVEYWVAGMRKDWIILWTPGSSWESVAPKRAWGDAHLWQSPVP